jgi:hypothetical protein
MIGGYVLPQLEHLIEPKGTPMWKAIDHMDLAEVRAAAKANRRELKRLQKRLAEFGGHKHGATIAAYERRRVKLIALCDRERQLRSV